MQNIHKKDPAMDGLMCWQDDFVFRLMLQVIKTKVCDCGSKQDGYKTSVSDHLHHIQVILLNAWCLCLDLTHC